MITRGCGVRVRGGVYIEIEIDPNGRPIEDYFLDPPIQIDPQKLGVSPIGAHLIEHNGEAALVDWVGSKHYPNVLDFVEEARRFGISRRISSRVDLSTLRDARILFVHSRGFIENPEIYLRGGAPIYCPKDIPVHVNEDFRRAGEMCAGVYWDDVQGGAAIDPVHNGRVVRRIMPSFSYLARRPPDGAFPIYRPGAFMQFPIRRLVVVRESDGTVHPTTMRNLLGSGIPFEVVEE